MSRFWNIHLQLSPISYILLYRNYYLTGNFHGIMNHLTAMSLLLPISTDIFIEVSQGSLKTGNKKLLKFSTNYLITVTIYFTIIYK